MLFVACRVLNDLLIALLPEEEASRVILMEYGLHEHPQQLREALQEVLDGLEEPSLVVLGYGLCGNGLDGLESRRHTLLIPRVDDCIALLLGSYEAYREEFQAVPGTYYLSKGWLEVEAHPLAEYREYLERYGERKANLIMDAQYRLYERLVLVAHTQADLDQYREQAQEVAAYCARWDMRYEERVGSEAYVQRLVRVAQGLEEPGEDLLVVGPGETVAQALFLRSL
jgi:hypothetical protein